MEILIAIKLFVLPTSAIILYLYNYKPWKLQDHDTKDTISLVIAGRGLNVLHVPFATGRNDRSGWPVLQV